MTSGAQSRNDTPVGGGHDELDTASPNARQGLNCILAVRLRTTFGCRAGSRLSYYCRRLVKRKQALLGSNPPRNSRLETHSDGPGADRNWSASGTRRNTGHHLFKHRGRSPDPSKPTSLVVRL